MTTQDDAAAEPGPRRSEPALRDYIAAIALIALIGILALVLVGCQTERILSNVSGPV